MSHQFPGSIALPRSIPELPVRIAYFLLVGWWLTWLWILVAWLISLTVVGLPLARGMLNRVPYLLLAGFLRQRRAIGSQDAEIIVWRLMQARQRFGLCQALYCLSIGWWASFLWCNLAWLLCVTILGLPLGILMLAHLPAIAMLLDMGGRKSCLST